MKVNQNRKMYCISMTVILLTLVHTCTSAVFQSSGSFTGGVSGQRANSNQIQTNEQCKKYLCKYGYLDCNCNELLRRKRNALPNGIIPREQRNSRPRGSLTRPILSDLIVQQSNTPCTQQKIVDALKEFQKIYRLPQTGACDDVTMSSMSKRRCGQPDSSVTKQQQPGRLPNLINMDGGSRPKRHVLTKQLKQGGEAQRNYGQDRRLVESYGREVENKDSSMSLQKRKSILEKLVQVREDKELLYERDRRSVLSSNVQDYNRFWTKMRITWRIMSAHYSDHLPASRQREILSTAFKYWSSVTPMCFVEDVQSAQVDIEIGFLEGVHLSCVRQFDGYGGEVAHKYITDVHFDKSERYSGSLQARNSSNTQADISLLVVAVHELGHVLGLNHTDVGESVMNAMYHQGNDGVELTDHDREQVRNIYGPCKGSIDTAFDYVRWDLGANGTQERVFNTYFFRDNSFWMYVNGPNRTRSGDPLRIDNSWHGLERHMDAFFHYQAVILTGSTPKVTDKYFFFKGNKYYMYSSGTESVMESGLISEKFKPGPYGAIPNNLDTVFFDIKTSQTYFFKDHLVYTYKYSPTQPHSCCLTRPQSITNLFPPATPADLYSPEGNTYSSNIDSIYFSYYSLSFYIIKGSDVWQNVGYSISNPNSVNSVKYLGKWYDRWNYICDSECS